MDKEIRQFQKEVWKHYRAHGRHDLPWRKTHDPYKILVSEVMLQQTQVPRAMQKYEEFLKVFPTVYVLAQARLVDVLRVWSGLGYNRRGKYLHDAAKAIVSVYGGSIKDATSKKLPGVGPYTRAAVRTFAFNEPHTMIETNIRTAYIHHFFPEDKPVSDKDIIPFIERAAADQDPREWHWALMDYGSYLKKTFPNPSRRSAGHTRQSKFEGSLRQVRGEIIRQLHAGKQPKGAKGEEREKWEKALKGLEKDGMIVKVKGKWRVA